MVSTNAILIEDILIFDQTNLIKKRDSSEYAILEIDN